MIISAKPLKGLPSQAVLSAIGPTARVGPVAVLPMMAVRGIERQLLNPLAVLMATAVYSPTAKFSAVA